MEKLIGEFSFGLFFWQLFIFVGLLIFLAKFAWKPILNAVDERENSIKDALKAAEDARNEMAQLQSDNDRILKEARAEREALLKEAKATSNNLIAEAKVQAQEQAEKILAQAQEEIAAEKRNAIGDLKKQIAGISIDIAETLLQEELKDQDKQLEMIAKRVESAEIQ